MEEVSYEELKHSIGIFLELHHFSELQKVIYEAVKEREETVKKLYFPDDKQESKHDSFCKNHGCSLETRQSCCGCKEYFDTVSGKY